MSDLSTNGDSKTHFVRRIAIITAIAGFLLLVLAWMGHLSYKPGGVVLLASLPLVALGYKKLKGYTFTAWVFLCAGLAMFYPSVFISWGEFRLELLIIPLTQIIMFGMGTTLSLSDFARVAKAPWPVFIGMILQFGIMPLSGYFIAHSFGFSGELAAGIVLIGSCSGGVASNLMVYLARADVALSVTMTFVSTLMAPLATPLLMSNLAGAFVPIDAVQMMFSILNMIIVPVVAGLAAHEILYGDHSWSGNAAKLILLTTGCIALAIGSFILGPDVLGPLSSGITMGGSLIAVVTFTKLVMSVWLNRPNTWMDTVLPLVAKTAICMVIAIIIAQTREVLIAVGVTLLIAAVIHNTVGYLLGYWGSRAFGRFLGKVGYRLGLFPTPAPRITEIECRTIAFEVGMQNGGMASGLAIDVLESHVAALPPNVFGTWMNISGSMLANYWIQRPTDKTEIETITEKAPAT
ncbi:bile acid:sodium symporter family protein [Aliifodinibius sp. S!AR15-10]|uniref:bile acid:sodium symporter family protein n=1 Tax=Aliifodinibius sp. S!AR15-10 TaxID=2950437 RepID=UPI00285D0D3B|nr:bile acid:sodium symporter family protein [Aliifodinibius sp. S!AR15-10]MDR8393416.1 bile acid:sodium symporter family protein [Aliifodinibius sp. S!AR15-10]